MSRIKHIVKRGGHSEEYDERKLYASVYSACLAVREPSPTAELVAEKVCQDIDAWLGDKHEVTSNDIRRITADKLELYNPDAAYIYKHQRNLG